MPGKKPRPIGVLIEHLSFCTAGHRHYEMSFLRPDGWPLSDGKNRCLARHAKFVEKGRVYSDEEEKQLHRRQEREYQTRS